MKFHINFYDNPMTVGNNYYANQQLFVSYAGTCMTAREVVYREASFSECFSNTENETRKGFLLDPSPSHSIQIFEFAMELYLPSTKLYMLHGSKTPACESNTASYCYNITTLSQAVQPYMRAKSSTAVMQRGDST